MPLDKARLSLYCTAPASECELAKCNCDKCNSPRKEAAEKRFRNGAKKELRGFERRPI